MDPIYCTNLRVEDPIELISESMAREANKPLSAKLYDLIYSHKCRDLSCEESDFLMYECVTLAEKYE